MNGSPARTDAVLATQTGYRLAPCDELLPGYRLLRPLGRGGFGEVWECEAPGGLRKAIKVVFDDSTSLDATGGVSLLQEYEAFQHVKLIRHPFLLGLERVEMIDGHLVTVLELADDTLADRFERYRDTGLPGVPRAELLRHLADAAEALDLLADGHGLQHLDVKPANLFLVGNRTKVGDYGLVRRFDSGAGGERGSTPKYVSPEVAQGRIDRRSDQYSLALVYHELLTGTFPFAARFARQMLMLHAAAAPDLDPLPAADRPVVGRALAKNPADRFPTCTALVEALRDACGSDPAPAVAVRGRGPSKRSIGASPGLEVTAVGNVAAAGADTAEMPALSKSVRRPRLRLVVPVGPVAGTANTVGTRPLAADLVRAILQGIPRANTSARGGSERRSAERLPADYSMVVFPVADDGRIADGVRARCRNVSATGVRFVTETPVAARHVYAAFVGCGKSDGWAVLVKVVRKSRTTPAQIVAGRFPDGVISGAAG